MKRKRVWRYYCDFCRKGSCAGGHMKRHEESCTLNPERKCRLCVDRFTQQPMKDLIAALGSGDEAGVKALREKAEGCPICMLAAIRQSGVQKPCSILPSGEMDYGYRVPFEFRKELADFWSEEAAAKSDSALYM